MALTAAMTLAGAAKASGQSFIVNEGFEGDAFPPSGWTTVDADGDGHCWQIATSGHATLNGKNPTPLIPTTEKTMTARKTTGS